MDIAVPSRFACLKIEDDDCRPQKPKDSKKNADKQNVKKQDKGNNNKQDTSSKKVSNKQQSNKKQKKKQPATKQWEDWKAKDDELVTGNYEEDLKNAILLSKLDYEKKKEMYTEHEKESQKKTEASIKKKKNKVMSLEQFLGSDKADSNITEKHDNFETGDAKLKDEKFFERVQQEAKEELTKEKILQKRKEREANIEEIITIAQYQEKLSKEIEKNAILQVELDKAKQEIAEVKARNKTLYGILGHGEMKDKADVLLELERLTAIKNELTEEVSRLTGLLEQERSKVAALSGDSHHKKDKKQKKNGYNKMN